MFLHYFLVVDLLEVYFLFHLVKNQIQGIHLLHLLSLLGLTLILLPLAFVPSFLSYLVRKAAGPGASLFIVLPTVTVAIVLLFAVSCLPALVAVIVYQHLRAQVAGTTPAEHPETDGVPA